MRLEALEVLISVLVCLHACKWRDLECCLDPGVLIITNHERWDYKYFKFSFFDYVFYLFYKKQMFVIVSRFFVFFVESSQHWGHMVNWALLCLMMRDISSTWDICFGKRHVPGVYENDHILWPSNSTYKNLPYEITQKTYVKICLSEYYL